MVAKTSTERSRLHRENKFREGLRRGEFIAYPEDHKSVKDYAESTVIDRTKKRKAKR